VELDWIYGADRSPFRQEVAFNIGTSYHHKSFGGLQGFYISKPPPAHQKNRQNIVLRLWRHKIHERKDLLVATHAKQPLQNLLGTCEAKMIKNESSGKPIVPSPAIACVCVCGCALQKVNWVEQMDKWSTVYGMCFKRCIWLALPQIITSSNLHHFNIAMEFLPTYRWYMMIFTYWNDHVPLQYRMLQGHNTGPLKQERGDTTDLPPSWMSPPVAIKSSHSFPIALPEKY